MPVGNDVVDLTDPDNLPSAVHPRFDSRVFTEAERRLLAAEPDAGSDRHRVRWTLWAAKEAALKCLRQVEPSAPFRPRELEVSLAAPGADAAGAVGAARVRRGGREWRVTVDATAERVHAIAVPAEPDGVTSGGGRLSGARRVPEAAAAEEASAAGEDRDAGAGRDAAEISAVAHADAARATERLLGLPGGAVEVRPGDAATGGAPRAFVGDRVLPVEVSLSDDGRWAAFAVQSRGISPRTGPGAAPSP